MPKISAGIASLLGIMIVYFTLNMLIVWNSVPTPDKFRAFFECIYMVFTAVAGWIYVARQSKISGCVHALLMLGVAGVTGYHGFTVLGNRSIAGGSGPDANPVGGLLYGIAFIYCLAALVTGICAIGVIAHVLKNENNARV